MNLCVTEPDFLKEKSPHPHPTKKKKKKVFFDLLKNSAINFFFLYLFYNESLYIICYVPVPA